jgi:hypothetical protein
MNVTLKRLPAGATVNVFPAAKADPYVHYFAPVPSAPLATGVADASGNLTLNLPTQTELLAQLPSGAARRIYTSTTKGGS